VGILLFGCRAEDHAAPSSLTDFERALSDAAFPLLSQYFAIREGRVKHCPKDARSWDHDAIAAATRSEGDSAGRFFLEMAALCDAYNETEAAAAPIFRKAATEHRVDVGLHAFSYLQRDLSDLDRPRFEEVVFGPFPDIATCSRVEGVIRDAYLPTTRCHEWSDLKQWLAMMNGRADG
jgi:hypothetical protein